MRRLILSFILASSVSALLSLILGPENYIDIILHSPQGLVVIGRDMMVYNIVYPLLTAFNNSVGLTAALSSPPLIHSAYRMKSCVRCLGYD